jgi:uncharacterized protein (TIGR03437 family)
MKATRAGHAATLLPDGTVLIAGAGFDATTVEIYEPDTGTFTETSHMISPRPAHTATLLGDGTVLIAGGVVSFTEPITVTETAEIYHLSVDKPAPVLFSDANGQATILHASTQHIFSENMPAAAGEALEIVLNGLIEGSVIPPQASIGRRIAQVLFFGDAPSFSGLHQVDVRLPLGIAPGPAVPVHLMYLARPSNEVTIGVQ